CAGVDLSGSLPAAEAAASLEIGPTQSATTTPPAISGGTLMVMPDGARAVAADPDRDQIYVIDLYQRRVTATLVLQPGDEPGRVVADSRGMVHVALRGGGALLTLNPISGMSTRRVNVCTAPRGLGYDATSDLVHVACAGGELVSVAVGSGEITRTLHLDGDLRDVVVEGNRLRVSRFRSADILTISADGALVGRINPGEFRAAAARGGQRFTASVAWRMLAMPGGVALMVHQRGVTDRVPGHVFGTYGGNNPCQSIVHSAVTALTADGSLLPGVALGQLPLPVDIALSADGRMAAIVAAGNSHSTANSISKGPSSPFRPSLYLSSTSSLLDAWRGCDPDAGGTSCGPLDPSNGQTPECSSVIPDVVGEPIAVAFTPSGTVIVQSREPAVLNLVGGGAIELSPLRRQDTGHLLFHMNAGVGLACASCHAEGDDDGRVWNFACSGPRRTQSLRTGIRGTEPLHWDGDERDFPQLVRDIFTARMAGPALQPDQVEAMLEWVDGQPRKVRLAATDMAAVQRGGAIFRDSSGATCGACHSGEHLTNGQTVDVGTGGAFQVPSLTGVANHPPYMHDGCAATLRDRFSPLCGGGDRHGRTSQLNAGDLSDLLAYLETL
ncbi:MAG: hypothetical protein ABJA82_17380, partial [Myxococcales bacterium]